MGEKGKLADRYWVKGPTSKLLFMASLRGARVEYFYQIAFTCLKMITNHVHCRTPIEGMVRVSPPPSNCLFMAAPETAFAPEHGMSNSKRLAP
jgi:hypothetical protein